MDEPVAIPVALPREKILGVFRNRSKVHKKKGDANQNGHTIIDTGAIAQMSPKQKVLATFRNRRQSIELSNNANKTTTGGQNLVPVIQKVIGPINSRTRKMLAPKKRNGTLYLRKLKFVDDLKTTDAEILDKQQLRRVRVSKPTAYDPNKPISFELSSSQSLNSIVSQQMDTDSNDVSLNPTKTVAEASNSKQRLVELANLSRLRTILPKQMPTGPKSNTSPPNPSSSSSSSKEFDSMVEAVFHTVSPVHSLPRTTEIDVVRSKNMVPVDSQQEFKIGVSRLTAKVWQNRRLESGCLTDDEFAWRLLRAEAVDNRSNRILPNLVMEASDVLPDDRTTRRIVNQRQSTTDEATVGETAHNDVAVLETAGGGSGDRSKSDIHPQSVCSFHETYSSSVSLLSTSLHDFKHCYKCGAKYRRPLRHKADTLFALVCRRGHTNHVTKEMAFWCGNQMSENKSPTLPSAACTLCATWQFDSGSVTKLLSDFVEDTSGQGTRMSSEAVDDEQHMQERTRREPLQQHSENESVQQHRCQNDQLQQQQQPSRNKPLQQNDQSEVRNESSQQHPPCLMTPRHSGNESLQQRTDNETLQQQNSLYKMSHNHYKSSTQCFCNELKQQCAENELAQQPNLNEVTQQNASKEVRQQHARNDAFYQQARCEMLQLDSQNEILQQNFATETSKQQSRNKNPQIEYLELHSPSEAQSNQLLQSQAGQSQSSMLMNSSLMPRSSNVEYLEVHTVSEDNSNQLQQSMLINGPMKTQLYCIESPVKHTSGARAQSILKKRDVTTDPRPTTSNAAVSSENHRGVASSMTLKSSFRMFSREARRFERLSPGTAAKSTVVTQVEPTPGRDDGPRSLTKLLEVVLNPPPPLPPPPSSYRTTSSIPTDMAGRICFVDVGMRPREMDATDESSSNKRFKSILKLRPDNSTTPKTSSVLLVDRHASPTNGEEYCVSRQPIDCCNSSMTSSSVVIKLEPRDEQDDILVESVDYADSQIECFSSGAIYGDDNTNREVSDSSNSEIVMYPNIKLETNTDVVELDISDLSEDELERIGNMPVRTE